MEAMPGSASTLDMRVTLDQTGGLGLQGRKIDRGLEAGIRIECGMKAVLKKHLGL